MDLSRQEYPAIFRSLEPSQATAVLDERVKLIKRINIDISEWLAERRRVEEVYVNGLRKLASKSLQTTTSDLGVFQTPWQGIVSSVESFAQSHSILAQRIESDVERPLREYQSKNRELQNIGTIQGNLGSIAKDVDNAQKRADKVKEKSRGATKVANADSDLKIARQQWQSQSPYVFEQLQALDETRVNHLRDVLTQLQTHEVDQVERNRKTAETCLNSILNVTTSDEISGFVAKNAVSGSVEAPPRKNRSATANSSTAPPVPRTPDDEISPLPSASTAPPPTLRTPSSSAAQERKPSGFGGLRRLGTVMGRGPKNKPTDRPSSPERRSRPTRNPLRRGPSSRDMQTIPSPQTSLVHLPSSPPRQEPALSRSSGTAAAEPTLSSREPQRPSQRLNGDTVQPTPPRTSSLPMTNGIQNEPDSTRQPSLPMPIQDEPQPGERSADGFSTRPSGVDDITRAQQEAAATGPEQAQFKLDIRSHPIQEEGDAQSAISNVANTLRAQQGVTPRKPGSNRGRRDVRNTMFVPGPQTPEIPGITDSPGLSASPFNPTKSTSYPTDPYHNSDSQSVRSAQSINSMSNSAVKHPDMHQPGLNASLVETVSASFAHGAATKAVVVGELALANNPSESATSSSSASLRLENFAVLEKVAPNPTFITQAPSRSGEYSVDLTQIPRTSVAFKYQVHLEDSSLGTYAPISLTPSWKIEPTQASVILSYVFNLGFAASATRSVLLKNVIISIGIEGSKASTCQSKPVGAFSKERSLIYWRLGDITLDSSFPPQKLLARFSTESEAKPGNAEVKWEISGEHAVGLGSGLGLSQMTNTKGGGGSDPFADEGAAGNTGGEWKNLAVTRKLVSGRYLAS